MRHLPVAILVAGACLSATSLAAPKGPPPELVARLQVAVDAAGRPEVRSVESISGLPKASRAYGRVAEMLRTRVGSWTFEPAKRGGVAAPSQTYVNVWLEGRDDGKGNLVLFITNADTGPGVTRMDPPRYPARARASDGRIVLVLSYDVTGAVTAVEVESGAASQSRDVVVLADAATKAASHWMFKPEYVQGEPRDGRVRIPVTFCRTVKCSGFDEPVFGGSGHEPVALEPAVGLRSAVAGTAL